MGRLSSWRDEGTVPWRGSEEHHLATPSGGPGRQRHVSQRLLKPRTVRQRYSMPLLSQHIIRHYATHNAQLHTSEVNSASHPSWVAKSSTSCGWGNDGKVTAARWQVTLCDPIWHAISRSGVVMSITNCYIRVYFLFFTYFDFWPFDLECSAPVVEQEEGSWEGSPSAIQVSGNLLNIAGSF